jgi:hypothetical protein
MWKDLTKVISFLNKRSQDWHVSAGNWNQASVVRGKRSSKELFEQRILIAIRNIYIWARDMATPRACDYLNIHEHTWAALVCRPNSTCELFNPEYWHQHLQVRLFTVKQDRLCQGHHFGETWPRSSPSLTRGPKSEPSLSEALKQRAIQKAC